MFTDVQDRGVPILPYFLTGLQRVTVHLQSEVCGGRANKHHCGVLTGSGWGCGCGQILQVNKLKIQLKEQWLPW